MRFSKKQKMITCAPGLPLLQAIADMCKIKLLPPPNLGSPEVPKRADAFLKVVAR